MKKPKKVNKSPSYFGPTATNSTVRVQNSVDPDYPTFDNTQVRWGDTSYTFDNEKS